MYYQNYEDYMRQMLGYPVNDPSIYEPYNYRNNQTDTYSSNNQPTSNLSEEEIRDCYPEIYHLVYPMVCKVCDTNTAPITKELIEQMTDEVYFALEDSTTVVNVRAETQKPVENRSVSTSSVADVPTSKPKMERFAQRDERKTSRFDYSRNSRFEDPRTPKYREERIASQTNNAQVESSKTTAPEATETATQPVENRQINSTLRDLIKILILFRLFENKPINPRPPRPTFPGGPGMPPYPVNFF